MYLLIRWNEFVYFFIKTEVKPMLGPDTHCLVKAIIMGTNNIGFYGKMTEYFFAIILNRTE